MYFTIFDTIELELFCILLALSSKSLSKLLRDPTFRHYMDITFSVSVALVACILVAPVALNGLIQSVQANPEMFGPMTNYILLGVITVTSLALVAMFKAVS